MNNFEAAPEVGTEASLDYLMNEKFVQFAEPEQFEEYLLPSAGSHTPRYPCVSGQ